MAHQWYGLLLLYTGQFVESEERLRFALSLDPLYPNIHRNVGDVMAVSGRTEEAIRHLERSFELFPQFVPVRDALARNYLKVGKYTEAIELLPDNGYATYALLALGRKSEALALAERLEREGSLEDRLKARTAIGDVDGAYSILEQALTSRAPWVLARPNLYSYYDILRSDPRWADYLHRTGLEDYR
jgi:tetratricopeptide (TPR) repeat protein